MFSEKEFEINVPDFEGKGTHKRRIRSRSDIYDYLHYAMGIYPGVSECDHLVTTAGINICPVPVISQFSRQLYQMYQFCKQGSLPYEGGYLDQLEVYIEAAAIISTEESALAQKAVKSGK